MNEKSIITQFLFDALFQRLVNLIYNIFELREIRLSKDKIEYPQSVQHQSHFCDSLAKIIFGKILNNTFRLNKHNL